MLRRWLIALLILAATPAVASAAQSTYISSLRVNDEGAFIDWQIVLCTPAKRTVEWEITTHDLTTGRVRHFQGFKRTVQPRACGRINLGLRQRGRFAVGHRYRTFVTGYLGGTASRRSPVKTFRVYAD